MDIPKLFSKGMKYATDAGNIFYSRKQKLIDEWLKSDNNPRSVTPRKLRIEDLTDELEKRVSAIQYIITDYSYWKRENDLKIANTQVHLTCSKRRCKSHGSLSLTPVHSVCTVIAYKDYAPNKYFCDDCGSELESPVPQEMNFELYKLGITTS